MECSIIVGEEDSEASRLTNAGISRSQCLVHKAKRAVQNPLTRIVPQLQLLQPATFSTTSVDTSVDRETCFYASGLSISHAPPRREMLQYGIASIVLGNFGRCTLGFANALIDSIKAMNLR